MPRSARRCLPHGNSATCEGTVAMTRIAILFCTAAISLPLYAGSTLAPAKIYAQELVNQTVAKYPDLLVVAMHVTARHGFDNVVIASNLGSFGEKADPEYV